MAKKKTLKQKQKQSQKQSVVVNINQSAPKRKRARRKRGGEPVVYREFQKVIYSDANPIQIYENQTRYKNIDARPATKSETLSKLEDVGQVGREGRVEILPRTSREQIADLDFVTPVARASMATQTSETSQPFEMNLPQGDNIEMRLPANEAVRLMRRPENADVKNLFDRFESVDKTLKDTLKNAREGFNFEEYQPMDKPLKSKSIVNPTKKISSRKPVTDEQRAINNAKARARRAMKKSMATGLRGAD